jgi:hypothetical protein
MEYSPSTESEVIGMQEFCHRVWLASIGVLRRYLKTGTQVKTRHEILSERKNYGSYGSE